MVDSVQFSPSRGNNNSGEFSASRSTKNSPISSADGDYGVSKAPEPEAAESRSAEASSHSPVQTAAEQQQELNNLTLSVRRVVAEGSNTLELVRESVEHYLDESKVEPAEGGSVEIETAPVPSAESAPPPEVPKIAPPTVEQNSGGGEPDGARGEVVDVVS